MDSCISGGGNPMVDSRNSDLVLLGAVYQYDFDETWTKVRLPPKHSCISGGCQPMDHWLTPPPSSATTKSYVDVLYY